MEDWTQWFGNLDNVDHRDVKRVASDAKQAEAALKELRRMDEESFNANEISGIVADVEAALEADSEHMGDLGVKLDKALDRAEFLLDRLDNVLDAYGAMGIADNAERTARDVVNWCHENMPAKNWFWMWMDKQETKAVFTFHDDTEAIHFKMRWS